MDQVKHTIVAGVDFSEPSDLAVVEAIGQAERRGGGELHFVAVMDAGDGELPAVRDARVTEAAFHLRERLEATLHDRLVKRFGEKGPSFTTVIHVRVGRPADEIVRLARDVEADLVLVGTHGRRGMQRWLLGSVAERTLRLAHCPVLVVRPKGYPQEEAPEPPCPACVSRRRESAGAAWWCEEHSLPRQQPHALQISERFRYPNPIWFGGDA